MSEIFELIRAGDADAVRALVARDSSAASARDEDGVSALMQAAYTGNDDVTAVVREAAPPQDVFEAATFGDVDGLHGDPNVYSADGFTPLHFAVMGGHVDAARALLEAGADPNTMSRHRFVKVRPLHTACALEVAIENPDVVRLLVEHGADVHGRTAEGGATPLHNASQSGSVELVRTLLALGADPNVTTDDGRTPRDLAKSDDVRALF
jgi:ankyrin repeat protein